MNSLYKAPQIVNPLNTGWALFMEENSSVSNAEILGTSYIGFGSGFRGGLIRSYCEVGRYTRVGRGVSIGLGIHDYRNSSVAPFFDFPPTGWGPSPASVDPKRRVIIGNDCWIGDGVRINSGVTIGDGAVVGTSALVTKDVAPYEIVAGLPAKHLKWRYDEDVREVFQELRWWQYDPAYLLRTMRPDPRESIRALIETLNKAPGFSRPRIKMTPDILREKS